DALPISAGGGLSGTDQHLGAEVGVALPRGYRGMDARAAHRSPRAHPRRRRYDDPRPALLPGPGEPVQSGELPHHDALRQDVVDGLGVYSRPRPRTRPRYPSTFTASGRNGVM